jgi:hypothetical protein
MMAIENTIAGSLLHNYDLMRASGTTIVGEHKLHICHCICCLPTTIGVPSPKYTPIPWLWHSAASFWPTTLR